MRPDSLFQWSAQSHLRQFCLFEFVLPSGKSRLLALCCREVSTGLVLSRSSAVGFLPGCVLGNGLVMSNLHLPQPHLHTPSSSPAVGLCSTLYVCSPVVGLCSGDCFKGVLWSKGQRCGQVVLYRQVVAPQRHSNPSASWPPNV